MIREQEYRITENDSNVTSSAGVIGTMTDIETFTCPASTAFVIRPGDVFSLYADASGTEVGDSTAVELEIRDSNNITRNARAPQMGLASTIIFSLFSNLRIQERYHLLPCLILPPLKMRR